MAKRELIDKNEIHFTCRHNCFTGNCTKCDEQTVTQYEINEISVITEEEIVKPILDKIRDEIDELWKNEPCAIECGCLDEILQIIDKYKAESEDKE